MILSNDNINGSASSNICRLMFQKSYRKNHNIEIRVIFVYLTDEKNGAAHNPPSFFIPYIANVI